MGWGGRGISLINKGVDFDGSVCVLFCVRQDENHALVALAVQIMCYYACALFGAVSVQAAFFSPALVAECTVLLPEQLWSLCAIMLSGDVCLGWPILW